MYKCNKMCMCICMVMYAYVTMCCECLAVERHQKNVLLSVREHLMANVHLTL